MSNSNSKIQNLHTDLNLKAKKIIQGVKHSKTFCPINK